jgi:hypothetical protein
VRVVNNVKEASELIEAGFEYVTEMDGLSCFEDANSLHWLVSPELKDCAKN